jgi:ankyrin repeat protein
MPGLLFTRGGNPNHKMSILGQTPLTPIDIAVAMDAPDAIRTLARHGAKLDAADADGMTGVSWAALLHKDRALQALLELGAKRDVRDKYKLTPLEHTRGILYSSSEAGRLLSSR